MTRDDYADMIQEEFNCSEAAAKLVAEKAVNAMKEYDDIEVQPKELVELLKERGSDSVESKWNELCGMWAFISESDKRKYKV